MAEFMAYHVVTEKPMHPGQIILFDDTHHNGVYQRVMEKMPAVNDIYAHPEKYDAASLEHHTSVALRECALEKVRKMKYPHYPSRMGCLYVSSQIEEAEKWGELFAEWGRPTYHIVKLKICGNQFVGDANNCFTATLCKEENLALAERYWNNSSNPTGEAPILEILVNGKIEVIEMIKEIQKNL